MLHPSRVQMRRWRYWFASCLHSSLWSGGASRQGSVRQRCLAAPRSPPHSSQTSRSGDFSSAGQFALLFPYHHTCTLKQPAHKGKPAKRGLRLGHCPKVSLALPPFSIRDTIIWVKSAQSKPLPSKGTTKFDCSSWNTTKKVESKAQIIFQYNQLPLYQLLSFGVVEFGLVKMNLVGCG